MECQLCLEKEANKKNTHFLTDSIIRPCLNQDGVNERDKGAYFDISNSKPFVEFNFQQSTTPEKLFSILGREPNDEEIENAKQIPFSVDYTFCKECEDKFTSIENRFIGKHLKNFRNNKYLEKISFPDYKDIKLFFLLQVWRTSICDDFFLLENDIKEELRLIIFNHEEITPDSLNKYPLTVTFLTTSNDEDGGMTGNFVGYTDDKNPNLILMNDFIIQFYRDIDSVTFFEFYNLNSKDDFMEYLNRDDNEFVFKVMDNKARKALLSDFIKNDKIKALTKYYADNFTYLWLSLFGFYPSKHILGKYLLHLTNGIDENILHFSRENIYQLTVEYISQQLKS